MHSLFVRPPAGVEIIAVDCPRVFGLATLRRSARGYPRLIPARIIQFTILDVRFVIGGRRRRCHNQHHAQVVSNSEVRLRSADLLTLG